MVSSCNFRVDFVKRPFSTLRCVRMLLQLMRGLCHIKTPPSTTWRCIHRSSRNSCVTYVVHKRFLRRGTAEWLTAPKKTRWPGWPRWPLHEIAKWTAKLIELQSMQPRLRDIDFRLDKSDWPPGHPATANSPKADGVQSRHGGHATSAVEYEADRVLCRKPATSPMRYPSCSFAD